MRKMTIALCALVTTLFAGTALATQWNMATPYPDSNFHTRNDYQFAKDIQKATDGKLQITIHSGGSLIKHPQIKRAVRTGQVQAGEVLMSILGNQQAIFAIDSIPFLATSYDQAKILWDVSKPRISELMDKQGLKLLYAVAWPPQGLYTNKKVNSVEDLHGLKFRAYNSMTSRLAKLAGMVPTQVEVPDVPQAFATGIVEAMMTSPTTGVNTQAWDYAKYYYPTKAWLPKNMVFVNKKAFEALDPDVQQAVLKAAKTAEKRGWETSKVKTNTLRKELADHGMEIVQPPPKLEKGLQKIGAQLTQYWINNKADEAGKKVIDEYNARIKQQ